MSYICANDESRSQVGATNRLENIVIRYVSVVSLSSTYLHVDTSKVTAHERIQHLYHYMDLERETTAKTTQKQLEKINIILAKTQSE
jgi:hypothetical protein